MPWRSRGFFSSGDDSTVCADWQFSLSLSCTRHWLFTWEHATGRDTVLLESITQECVEARYSLQKLDSQTGRCALPLTRAAPRLRASPCLQFQTDKSRGCSHIEPDLFPNAGLLLPGRLTITSCYGLAVTCSPRDPRFSGFNPGL